MEHFVRVVMEKQEGAQLLDESIFAEQEIYETEQGATVYEIALPRELSEDEADEYANRLANYMFEQGYEDFDIEISMNEAGEEYSNVVVKGNNTKIPTVAQQLGWKTEPSVMGREFTTILPDSKPLTKDAVDKFIADLGLKFSSGTHAKSPFAAEEETYDGDDFYEEYGVMWFNEDDDLDEAEYQGRKVKLGKPMRGDVKKFKVYVRDPKTKNVKKVNFGDPNMKIKKSNPARRRSFRARHNCDNPGPRTKARYWSCRKW